MTQEKTGSRKGGFAGLVQRADRALALASGLLIAGIGLLTCIDVFGRYALGRPLQGAFEISELAMGALIFTSLPLVTMRGQHVTIDLLDGLLPASARRVQAVVIDLLSALCTAVLAWRLWARGGEMASSGETTAILQLAVYPLVYYMALLSALAALFGLLLAGRHMVAGGPVEPGVRG